MPSSVAPDTSAKRLLLPLAIVLALASLELGCGGNVVIDHGGNGQGGSGGGSSGASMLGTPETACILNESGLKLCEQIFNAPANEVESIKQGCASSNGKLVAACSADGVVGCCVIEVGVAKVEECFYSGLSLMDAQTACQGQNGTFSTSP